ncbi:unnamed protein product, partial [Didymodactylos carnosus]
LKHSFEIQRTCNQLEKLIQFHHHVLSNLHNCIKTNNGVGGVFLQLATTLDPLFELYCQQYAKTILFCHTNKDKIQFILSKTNSRGTNNYLLLIKNLSLPLNTIEKYSILLNEYLHNLENFHSDRGDAQRAVDYYSKLARSGNELRKRKEWELEVLNGKIHGLDSETLWSLGEILYLTPVSVLFENGQSSERIALLYSSVLIFISMTNSRQEYKFENYLLISHLILNRIDDELLSERALKITVPSLSLSMIISFPNVIEFNNWCEKIRYITYESKYGETLHTPQVSKFVSSLSNYLPKSPTSTGVSFKIPLRSPEKSPLLKSCLRPHSSNRIRLVQTIESKDGLNEFNSGTNKTSKSFLTMRKIKTNEFVKRGETSEDDSLLLSVIEAYYGVSGNSRFSLSTSGLNEQNIPVVVSMSNPVILNGNSNISNMTNPLPITSLVKSIAPALDSNRCIIETINELRLILKMIHQELEEGKIARYKLESKIQCLLTTK